MPHEHVVIVGGGFGGLYAAKALGSGPVRVTLIDRRNFHLFQPLLYQVATAGLSPGNIAAPLRGILQRHPNISVLLGDVVDIEVGENRVLLASGEMIDFDKLILAAGSRHSYFGNDQWADYAPGLKSVEDALNIRSRVLRAYENAELESDPAVRQEWLTFVVVGAGPTGVELAGAIAEMAHHTLRGDFRSIEPATTKVYLLELLDRVLPPYDPKLSDRAAQSLELLGVTVRTGTRVVDLSNDAVRVRQADEEETIRCRTVVWAAGVQASPLGKALAERVGLEADRNGRVPVQSDLSVAGAPNVFVVGDLARFDSEDKPLPGLAPVAMQQGEYVGKLILKRLAGKQVKDFTYTDRGSMATIGRAAAVADIRGVQLHGLPAWLAWLFIHLMYLVGFDNRMLVFVQWFWNYITYKRGVRLIVGRIEEPKDS